MARRPRILVGLLALTLVGVACGSPASSRRPAVPAPDATPVLVAGIGAAERADMVAPARPPVRFAIPKIGVEAAVEAVDFLAVPAHATDVAWFRTGPAPGEQGDAVIDGHLDWTTGPAVFWRLHEVAPGDSILVTGSTGSHLKFVIDHVDTVAASSTPPPWLYTTGGTPSLSLITCEGTYTTGGYDHRLLVHSVLAGVA